ncbi:Serine racemase [Botrytis cinerea]
MADPNTRLPLNRQSVLDAHELIKPHIHYTPVLTNKTIDDIASTPQTADALKGTEWEGKEPAKPKIRLWFKCENLQRVGAFKVRGAFHALKRLEEAEGGVEAGHGEGGWRQKGVVTHSSGNHAQALALAARELGIPAHIVMPTISTPSKIAATKGYGANVRFSGSTSVEREAMVEEVIKETGARLVPPYDHPDIMAGQGTLGLELAEQVRQLQSEKGMGGQDSQGVKGLDAIITPCGGGGADDGRRGFEQGKRIESVKSLTIADGLRTPVGKIPWSVIFERGLVQGMFAVTEEQIRKAMRLVVERMKVVVEPICGLTREENEVESSRVGGGETLGVGG